VTGTIQKLPYGAVARSEPVSDLLIRAALELPHDDRVTLARWERLDGADEFFKLVPAPRGRELVQRVNAVMLRAFWPGSSTAEHADRGVVCHRVKPRTERPHFAAALQSRVRVQERILDRFLCVRISQDARAVPQQRPSIPMHDRLEGRG
jgi:hypothetical protein